METMSPLDAVSAYDVFKMSCPSRRVFDLIGERWTGLVLLALRGEPQRFSALRRQIEGISQKMLTQTLRTLEREGLVQRAAFATVPVTVEYSLTSLGDSFAAVVEGLRTWAYANAESMEAARRAFGAAARLLPSVIAKWGVRNARTLGDAGGGHGGGLCRRCRRGGT